MMLEQYGMLIGLVLLGVVSLAALLLGRKAARNVASFRQETHERFQARGPQ